MSDAGIKRLEDGTYEIRFSGIGADGKRHEYRRRRDDAGRPLSTITAARKERERQIKKGQAGRIVSRHRDGVEERHATVGEVWQAYQETGTADRAESTLRRQRTIYRHHIEDRWRDVDVRDLRTAEISDDLARLYYDEGYSYSYVEGILKEWYLILGQAQGRGYLSAGEHATLCVNKLTKIRMPKRRADDGDEIMTYTREQLDAIGEMLQGTNAETTYMLARYAGLRIGEIYGLQWGDVDSEGGILHIRRQMTYNNDGLIALKAPKTSAGVRDIVMPQILTDYLTESKSIWESGADRYQNQRRQRRREIWDDVQKEWVGSIGMVGQTMEGELLTTNSLKYWARECQRRLGFPLRIHWIRHTYASSLAAAGMPEHILCRQMGHARIQVTHHYYAAMSDRAVEVARGYLQEL